MELIEQELKHGALADPKDEKDYIFEEVLGSGEVMSSKEWEEGYDIENIVGKIPVKNQYQSQSCVGQAYAYYKAVLDAIEEGSYNEQSAKAIYSHISIGYAQGAYLRDGAKHLVDPGSLLETRVRSYKEDGTTDEAFMLDKTWVNPEIIKEAYKLGAKEYRRITGATIDHFARAIKEGNGCVIGVVGTNNGTWTSKYPIPPTLQTPNANLWGHAVFAGKFRIKDGKRQIGILNSWGDYIGDNGWQWIGEEWFADEGRWIFNPWVVIDKPNNNNKNMTFKKLKNNPAIYLINELRKTKIMIVDMETLEALQGGFEEVESLEEYKDDGTLVWVNRIID